MNTCLAWSNLLIAFSCFLFHGVNLFFQKSDWSVTIFHLKDKKPWVQRRLQHKKKIGEHLAYFFRQAEVHFSSQLLKIQSSRTSMFRRRKFEMSLSAVLLLPLPAQTIRNYSCSPLNMSYLPHSRIPRIVLWHLQRIVLLLLSITTKRQHWHHYLYPKTQRKWRAWLPFLYILSFLLADEVSQSPVYELLHLFCWSTCEIMFNINSELKEGWQQNTTLPLLSGHHARSEQTSAEIANELPNGHSVE
jgi:hypothetical protein